MDKLERIMLIDDDADTNLCNKILLKQVEAANEILEFQEGEKALEYLQAANDGIDLLMLDINMPIMNGWKFLDEYDKLPATKQAKMMVMMVTSSRNIEDEKKALGNKKISKYIHKPLTKEGIADILALFK
ncbi:MAG: response regulator [Bacteroidota bacterium]